jgi:6-pyruvoyltetrahydropterin/6-carboxytetrahydropterin synthase
VIIARRYRFSASHRLHSARLSEAENTELYGKCNNPYGHGHNYVLEVAVKGVIDPDTGRVVSPAALDEYVARQVLEQVDHRDLNQDVPEFANTVPTTENLSIYIGEKLRSGWQKAFPGMDLDRVRVEETRRNSFELKGI